MFFFYWQVKFHHFLEKTFWFIKCVSIIIIYVKSFAGKISAFIQESLFIYFLLGNLGGVLSGSVRKFWLPCLLIQRFQRKNTFKCIRNENLTDFLISRLFLWTLPAEHNFFTIFPVDKFCGILQLSAFLRLFIKVYFIVIEVPENYEWIGELRGFFT